MKPYAPRTLASLALSLGLSVAILANTDDRLIPAAEPLPEPERAAMPVDAAQGAPTATPSQAAAAPAPGAGGPVVALLDFESNTLPSGEVQALSAALWSRLNVQGGVRLLPREETRAWLIRNDLHPFMPYQPTPVPLPRVAQALHADQVVTGRIDQVEGAWNLQLAVQGHRDAEPRQLAQVKTGKLDDIMLLMDSAARQARAGALGQPLQPLSVLGREPAAKAETPKSPRKAAVASKSKVSSRSAKVTGIVESAAAKRPRAERKLAALEPAESQKAPKAHATELIPAASEPAPAPAKSEPQPAASAESVVIAGPEAVLAPATQAAPAPSKSEPAKVEPDKTAEPHKAEPVPSPTASEKPAPHTPITEPAAPSLTPALSARNLYQQAVALDQSNPERLAKMEQAAQLAPSDAEIQLRLANEYYGREDFADAVEACDRALATRPDDSMLHTIKGSALFELRRYDDARDAHAAAIKADPKNNWARYNYALALTQLKSPQAPAAWKDYLAKAESDPAHRALLEKAREQLAASATASPSAEKP